VDDPDGAPARRGFGWVLQPNPRWVGAELCSPETSGHTGFTGTSLLIDPTAGWFAILLTNRVHPTRHAGSSDRIATLRTRFHNLVAAAMSLGSG
jgi:CubicO group peptidase (beta-lactamase class C family)